MPRYLSEQQIESYRAGGCVFPVDILSSAEAADHRRRLETAEAERGRMHYRVKPYLICSSANEIARHPILLDAVEDILGPDILLWDSAYVIKEAGDQRFVSWHQDLIYWGLDSDLMVTAWVALSPSRSLPTTSRPRPSPIRRRWSASSTRSTTRRKPAGHAALSL